jgi:hypothetical protein
MPTDGYAWPGVAARGLSNESARSSIGEFGCRYCYARPTDEYLGHAEPEEFEESIYM